MKKVNKAYALTDAKISFVSLVDKAANKKQFLITKSEGDTANFATFGRILKMDADSHFVTGIVYEPMVEDSQGEYMTEDEITKAAYWFAKNSNQVDIQHCFKKCDGAAVVESYVAKCDMEIEGEAIKKGTWLMTVEITDSDVWSSIEKGEITGFSMGGFGTHSSEDVELPVEKQDEPKGLFRKLAKAFGFDVVEKGAVKTNFIRRVKDDNFYSAWYALRNALEGNYYNPVTEQWEFTYTSDESEIKAALEDFNDIVTQLLTSDGSIVKSLERAAADAPAPVMKAGKSMSAKNLETLTGICNSLTEFISTFTPDDDDLSGDGDVTKNSANKLNNLQKEEKEMKKSEVQALVEESISKAMNPIKEQLEAIVKSNGDDVKTDGGENTPEPADDEASAEDVSAVVESAVAKALDPINKQLEVIRKSRALPSNLNDTPNSDVKKSEEEHYLHGLI